LLEIYRKLRFRGEPPTRGDERAQNLSTKLFFNWKRLYDVCEGGTLTTSSNKKAGSSKCPDPTNGCRSTDKDEDVVRDRRIPVCRMGNAWAREGMSRTGHATTRQQRLRYRRASFLF